MYKIYNEKTNREEVVFELTDPQYPHVKSRGNYLIFKSYFKYLSQISKSKEIIATGFKALDDALNGGLRPGLYVFGANPGLGKTSLMLHLALNLALKNVYVLYFNLEMEPALIASKIISNYYYRKSKEDESFKALTLSELMPKKPSLDLSKYIKEELGEKNLASLNDLIHKYILFMNKSKDNDISYVESVGVALKNSKDVLKITPVVIIDFLQLLKLSPVYNETDNEIANARQLADRRLEMNDIIDQLHNYSRVYNVPIILISSLSRGAYTKDGDEINEYSMASFKETGNIEYTADFLGILTKNDIDDLSPEDNKEVVLTVLKNRFGPPMQKVYFNFLPEYCFFEELDGYEDDEEDDED